MTVLRVAVVASAALLSTVAGATDPVDIEVRFLVEEQPMPVGTTFPRLPAGLDVALVPELRIGGAAVSREAAAAQGLSLRWIRLDPADKVTSNLQRSLANGETRIAASPLRTIATPLEIPNPWRVSADAFAKTGTTRFQVVAERAGEVVASTPGPQAQLELAPEVAGGLSPRVHGLTRRAGAEIPDLAAELDGVPFLLNPLGTPPRHQTEQRVGTDCTSTFIYALRRSGFEVPYVGPTRAWPYLEVLVRGSRRGEDGMYRREDGRVVELGAGGIGPGDLLHFGSQLSMLVQDRWPFGVLDEHDLLLQAWRSPPHRVSLAESEYVESAATVVRFRRDLPRRADVGLTVQVEDSHAGSFFHLRPALARGPATLIVLDAHSDAGPNPLAGELVQHEATGPWLRDLRERGVIQPTDWIDALIPWGVERVLWLGPWDEADRAREEKGAREMLCALATRFPGHGFGCRADRFHAATLEELLALPPDTPIMLSVDLDYLLRRDGSFDSARAASLQRVLKHFTTIRAASGALSRPWFPNDATFERALRAFSAAVWSSGRVDAVEVDLQEVQRNDRSMRVKQLLGAGTTVPRPRPEQIEGTPGLRLTSANPHASFGVLGDVYLSEAAWPVPTELPFALRASWKPPERLPVFANLETPVVEGRPVQGYPIFNRHGDLLDWLAREGVLVVSVANNHALDQGVEGLNETIRAARGRGIGVVGAWLPGELGEGVESVRIGDLRVAVLGVTYGLNAGIGPEVSVDVVPFERYPQDDAARAAEARFLRKVTRAAAGADVVVVLAHGGSEYVPGPAAGQQRFFAALTGAGAKVIVGSHAHVSAGVERKDGALLAWGLGDVIPRRGTTGTALRITAERSDTGLDVRAVELPRRSTAGVSSNAP